MIKEAAMKKKTGKILLLLSVLLSVLFTLPAAGQSTSLPGMPQMTETDCVWDEKGCLLSETAHDLQGRPALNARGFYLAEYKWDAQANLLEESYYGLSGEPVTADQGYARAVFTYGTDKNGDPVCLTEDRYAPDGSRADIPGSYSYLKRTLVEEQFVSVEYFDASGAPTRPTGGYAAIVY